MTSRLFCIKGVWGKMADDMTMAVEAIKQAAMDLIMPYAADLFDAELSEGGILYAQVYQGALLGAEAWYGMYTPTVYHRGMTLTNGMVVDHDGVQIEGHTLTSTLVVSNTSPHIGWTSGFAMWNGKFRPGGDIYKFVPPNVSCSIDVPKSICDQCLQTALHGFFGI